MWIFVFFDAVSNPHARTHTFRYISSLTIDTKCEKKNKMKIEQNFSLISFIYTEYTFWR